MSDFRLGNMATDLVEFTLTICNKDENGKARMMMREVAGGERTVEKFVSSYMSWRCHALSGDCYKMVAEWDGKIEAFLNSLGYGWKIKGNKVKLYVKDFGTA